MHKLIMHWAFITSPAVLIGESVEALLSPVCIKVIDTTTFSCSRLCEAIRLHAEMVMEGSYVLVLSCVERAVIQSWEWVTTSVRMAGNCSDKHLSSYWILAVSLEEGCSHVVAS